MKGCYKMNKKQICITNPPIATMGLTNTSGVAIHKIEYGIEDYVYASYHGGAAPTYHKCKLHCKVYKDGHTDNYFYIGRLKLSANDFMRV